MRGFVTWPLKSLPKELQTSGLKRLAMRTTTNSSKDFGSMHETLRDFSHDDVGRRPH